MKKKQEKKIKRKDTFKQKHLVMLITENLGKMARGEKAMSMYDIMLKVGYSEESARQQTNTLAGIQDKLDPIINKFIEKRDMAFNSLTQKKLTRAGASTLAYIIDIFTKNTELLSGRVTERTYNLTDAEKKKLDDLLKE